MKRTHRRHVRFIWFKDKPVGGIVSKCVLRRCFAEWDIEPRHSKGYWILRMLHGSGIDDDSCKECYPTFRDFIRKGRRWFILGVDEPCKSLENEIWRQGFKEIE